MHTENPASCAEILRIMPTDQQLETYYETLHDQHITQKHLPGWDTASPGTTYTTPHPKPNPGTNTPIHTICPITPKLTHGRFCPEHAKAEDQRDRRYQRDPKINRRYGSIWRKIRAAYIAAHPLCEECLTQGRYTPAQEVHHITPLEHGGTHDFTNMRSLCKPCPSRQTALDDDRWRRVPRVYSY